MSAESLPLPPELLVDEPPFTDADIDRWLDADPDEEWDRAVTERLYPPARWVIDGNGSAAWAMAHLSQIATELNAIGEQAQDWRDRISAWQDQRSAGLERRAKFFEGHLADYALRVREASGDEIKTVTLPTGTVKTTGHKAAVVVEDPERFIDWARGLDPTDYETVVQTTWKPIVAGVRAMVTIAPVADAVMLSDGHSGITNDGRLIRTGGDWAPGTWGRVWLGDAVECPTCGDDALVARIESSHFEAEHPSLGEVPGLGVEPASVSTKVVPDVG